jgi:2-succinyl-5-enolpyruvyl-6-hydroxy-3-cyclohexene-1-carboxylate synthase
MPPSAPADVAATFCATLVDEWVRAGVRHAVVAPGSRSTPLALALTERPELRVDVFHDERSASFAALGVGVASRVPAVLLCTSGTAAAHFHGAVAEADLSGVPMLVCTADRPPELHDVGAAQTIDQDGLYGAAARWFHAPGIADWATSGSWRSLAARAVVAAIGPDPGPVHLNLAFREPLVGNAGQLPAGRPHGEPWQRAMAAGGGLADTDVLTVSRLLDRQRGVIIAGAGCGAASALADLADATGWPVLADPRSGVRGLAQAIVRFDALLRSPAFAAAHAPHVVLRLGEAPASKVLSQWVAASGAVEVHASARPAVVDPTHAVAVRLTTDPSALCRRLAAALTGARGTPWAARWRHADATARSVIDEALALPEPVGAALASAVHTTAGEVEHTAPLPRPVYGEAEGSAVGWSGGGHLTEPALAATVLAGLPAGANLVVSSSMPIRALEWFGPPRDDVRVIANRGANGIDGVIATGIGVAAATGAPTAVFLGDVAMVHDCSSLAALLGRGLDVRIVVADNDGGGIFSFLPQRQALSADRFEQLFGTPHGTDLVALARAHGLAAHTATSLADVAAFAAMSGPGLIRVGLDRSTNVDAYNTLNAAVVQALDAR